VNDTFETHSDGRTILRVVKDLREMIANAPTDGPDVRSLLRDCDVLDRIGRWLSTCSYLKMRALYTIGIHLGMWRTRITQPETEALRRVIDVADLVAFGAVLIDRRSTELQRFCARWLLEFYLPSWRSVSGAFTAATARRDDRSVRQWRSAVLKRDRGICQGCGATERLHAHHLIPWALVPSLRLTVENGLTLCGSCHAGEHPELSLMRGRR
jgi:hypothetical protein